MSGEAFGIEKEFLHDILKEVRDGKTQLPEFQRDWVWPDTNVASLLASVSLSYPIGTVMMLQTGGAGVKFKQRPLEGAHPPAGTKPKRLILDGQQRLTALFQSLMLDRPVKVKDERGNPQEVWLYIDMRQALANGEREDAIRILPADKKVKVFPGKVIADYSTPESEYQAEMFPFCRVFDAANWRTEYFEYWQYDKEHIQFWNAFERELIESFTKYQVPVIELGAETKRQAVCQVFEKVNTGGVTLTVFELLTATFAADEFDLRRDWQDRDHDLKKPERRVLRDFANTDFLQIITLLATRDARIVAQKRGEDDERAPRVGCKRTDMLVLSLDSYRRWAPVAVDGLKRAVQFLHTQYVFDPKFLPYGGQLVPLAAIFAVLGPESDKQGVREQLERYYWSGVFGELYGGTTETRFSRDLLEVVEWVHGGAEPRTVTEAVFSPSRFLTLRTRISAAYKGIYALLLKERARDWRTGIEATVNTYFDDAMDIHHIFPKKWCKDTGVDPARYDSIVNKTPLAAATNRMIGGIAPSEYSPKVVQKAGISMPVFDANVATHLVDPARLRADDFDGFFAARSAALLDRISSAMGKPVATEVLSEPTERLTYDVVAEDDEDLELST